MGKMFCYAPNRKPPCRPTEGLPAILKHPHQQICRASTDRLGHNLQGAHFNQRHAPFLSWAESCLDEKETWCIRSSVGLGRKEGLIWYPRCWWCLFSWNGLYWLLLMMQKTEAEGQFVSANNFILVNDFSSRLVSYCCFATVPHCTCWHRVYTRFHIQHTKGLPILSTHQVDDVECHAHVFADGNDHSTAWLLLLPPFPCWPPLTLHLDPLGPEHKCPLCVHHHKHMPPLRLNDCREAL